jgi:DNA mismatch endonuclease (patch repair protein)
MRAIRRRDTKPERRLRSLLHARGLRYRIDHPVRTERYPRPIRPDIAFTRARVAVFWDGCYWHGCDDPECGNGPRPNIKNGHYWLPKIAGNRDRDDRQTDALKADGWLVLRFWGHELPEQAARMVERVVRGQAATGSAIRS